MRWWLGLAALAANAETYYYTAEWRGLDAGRVELRWEKNSAHLRLQSVGFVAKLYKVDDYYEVSYDDKLCVSAVTIKEEEGKKKRTIRVAYGGGKARYSDGEMEREVAVPPCVHDLVAGILQLRRTGVATGKKMTIPVSDGRRFAEVQVTGQERETVKTPAGSYQATRIEAMLFNGVIFRRRARSFMWFTEDERRMPVQFRVQLPFLLGTVNLHLVKETRD
jgi:hypothetical protein